MFQTPNTQTSISSHGTLTSLLGVCRIARLRYLGLGFVWAWVYCSFETTVLYQGGRGIGIFSDSSWLFSCATVTLCLVVFGVVLQMRRPSKDSLLAAFSSFALSLGTVLSVASNVLGFGTFADAAAGLLTGSGSAGLVVLWCAFLSQLRLEEAEVSLCLSSVITVACSLVINFFQGMAGLVAVASLPLISGAFFVLSRVAVDPEAGGGESAQGKKCEVCKGIHPDGESGSGWLPFYSSGTSLSNFLRSIVIIAVIYFSFGFMDSFAQPGTAQVLGLDVPTFIGSALGVVVLVLFVSYSQHLDFGELFRWVIPLVIVDLALASWDSAFCSAASSALSTMVDTLIQAMALMCLIMLAKRNELGIYFGAGLCQGIIQLGVLAGNLAGLLSMPILVADDVSGIVAALALICLVAVAGVLQPYGVDYAQPVDVASSEAIVGAGFALPRSRGAVEAESDRTAQPLSLEDRVASLAVEYRLSVRETEVLGFLAQGRSQPYIREQLVLSKNTVATHVKHIYAKLGVHSRQELLDMVERL